MEKDYRFAVLVAERERQRLLDSLRHRLIQNVNQKMATLQRDKEKLDIADTNSLLHHPTQFSINNVASPGGPQSNRKTRHTRHRLEVDEADTSIAHGGNVNGKRKRKVVTDTENGSPGPSATRDADPTNRSIIKDQTSVDVPPVVPLYTLDRLFTDRELTANLQQATYDVIQSCSASSRRRKVVQSPPDQPEPAESQERTTLSADILPLVDSIGDVAMDRTPSQLYHATRSAGRLQTTATPLNTLGELAGRQSAADLIGSYTRGSDKNKRDGDDYQRAPPLSDQEAAEDLKLIEEAVKREDESEELGADEDPEDNRKLLDLVLDEERYDYVGPVGFAT